MYNQYQKPFITNLQPMNGILLHIITHYDYDLQVISII